MKKRGHVHTPACDPKAPLPGYVARPVPLGYLLQEVEAGRASTALFMYRVGQMVDARAATMRSLTEVLLCAERVTR